MISYIPSNMVRSLAISATTSFLRTSLLKPSACRLLHVFNNSKENHSHSRSHYSKRHYSILPQKNSLKTLHNPFYLINSRDLHNNPDKSEKAGPIVNQHPTGEIINNPEAISKFSREAIDNALINMISSTVFSSTLSGCWLWLTDQTISSSPVALAIVSAGVICVAKNVVEVERVHHYAKLSRPFNRAKLSKSAEVNAITSTDLTPDSHKDLQTSLARIKEIPDVSIPKCMLIDPANEQVANTMDRWLVRFTLPFSVLNIIMISSKQRKSWDDYVAIGASSANIADFCSGPSVDEARKKFTDYLAKCTTIEELLELLIHPDALDSDMSFLYKWVEDAETIGVRVGRTGTLKLYKKCKSSSGGPYPIEHFPLNENISLK